MAPVLTTALTRLRSDFNTIAPNRDHESDGWIGDQAHKERISGHNPDESGGGEYEDADTKDEVRAIDVDRDLRTPSLTMQMCINQILASPNDLKRLRYIIFNSVIWSKSSGWRPREYTGSNPHDHHAHFSGDPLYDEDDAPWSILSLGEENELDDKQSQQLRDTHYTTAVAIANPTGDGKVPLHVWANWMAGMVKVIAAKVDIDPSELEAIKQAAHEGAAESAQTVIDGVLAGLPEGQALSKDDVRQAMREFYAPVLQ